MPDHKNIIRGFAEAAWFVKDDNWRLHENGSDRNSAINDFAAAARAVGDDGRRFHEEQQRLAAMTPEERKADEEFKLRVSIDFTKKFMEYSIRKYGHPFGRDIF